MDGKMASSLFGSMQVSRLRPQTGDPLMRNVTTVTRVNSHGHMKAFVWLLYFVCFPHRHGQDTKHLSNSIKTIFRSGPDMLEYVVERGNV